MKALFSLPADHFYASVLVVGALLIPFYAGRSLGEDIFSNEKFQVWEISQATSPYYASVADFGRNGLVLWKCDVTEFPIFLPYSQLLKLELGADPWTGLCSPQRPPLDLEAY